MKLFSCNACGHGLYFHNVECTFCGHRLGFVPELLDLVAFNLTGDAEWQPVGNAADGVRYRPCANYTDHNTCNWMVPAGEANPLCTACRLNRTIPDLTVPGNTRLWQRLQTDRNRLVYSLLRLNLPVQNRQESPDNGLAFDFLGEPDPRFREDSSVMTGHRQGVITVDIAEADDATRERVRQEMAEPYRTILGHFRHESGHYYWDRLVRDTGSLGAFRERFGDERSDYGAALERHYTAGPPPDWPQHFISAYASTHPWEDWAESWAHYLHIVDTLETAWQFGLRLKPRIEHEDRLDAQTILDPYGHSDFQALAQHWFPLTIALNNLNQSMGQPDAYPFVLSPVVTGKLELVHDIIHGGTPSARVDAP
ncbi:MAG TPA: putative zinc-binding peptidase [Gammaproteobacteria bacterium]|nr:putative zinc-binding peptidase [Gammaproteobacteria bacterium]